MFFVYFGNIFVVRIISGYVVENKIFIVLKKDYNIFYFNIIFQRVFKLRNFRELKGDFFFDRLV